MGISQSDLVRIVTGAMPQPAIGKLLGARLVALRSACRALGQAGPGLHAGDAPPSAQLGPMSQDCKAHALRHPLVPVWLREGAGEASAPMRAKSSADLGAASKVLDLGEQQHRLLLVRGSHLGSGAHGVVMAGLLLDPAGSAQCACAVKFMSVGYAPLDTAGVAQAHLMHGQEAGMGAHASQGQPGDPPRVTCQYTKALKMCLSEAEVLKQVG